MISMNSRLSLMGPSGIRRFSEMAREVPDCVKLTLGEPDFATPEPIKAAAAAALAADRTHYASNQGLYPLREAIAAYETLRGMPLAPEQILMTVGATEALYLAVFGVLDPGEEVIIPTPAYSAYETAVTVAGGVPVLLDTASDGFQITEAALAAKITPRTKAIVLNSPNNPTGTIYSEASLAAVKKAALDHNIFLIYDHVYSRLTYRPCPDLSLDSSLRDRLILCQSFSKPYAMTGWRVGYLAGPREVTERLVPLHAATVSCIPTFVQYACMEALRTDPSPMLAEYRRRRDYVLERLRPMGLSCPEPGGAFYIFPHIARFGLSSQEFCTRLLREGRVATVPGSCFGSEGYFRLSYCCAMEQLEKGMDRLEAFLAAL